MAVIIADAGPLIALAKVDQLELLPRLFPSITITQAVADECLRNSSKDGLLIELWMPVGCNALRILNLNTDYLEASALASSRALN